MLMNYIRRQLCQFFMMAAQLENYSNLEYHLPQQHLTMLEASIAMQVFRQTVGKIRIFFSLKPSLPQGKSSLKILSLRVSHF